MKLFRVKLFFLIAAVALISSSSRANPLEITSPEVTLELSQNGNTPPVKILGKGIAGKKSHESLALACVGMNYSCDKLQFIYFKDQTQRAPVGPTFTVKDRKALKHLLKSVSKQARNGNRAMISLVAEIGVLVALTPILDSAIPLYIAVFGPFMIMGAEQHQVFDLMGDFKDVSKTNAGSMLINQNGWNWAEDARSIREKQFQRMLKFIQNPNGFEAEIQNE